MVFVELCSAYKAGWKTALRWRICGSVPLPVLLRSTKKKRPRMGLSWRPVMLRYPCRASWTITTGVRPQGPQQQQTPCLGHLELPSSALVWTLALEGPDSCQAGLEMGLDSGRAAGEDQNALVPAWLRRGPCALLNSTLVLFVLNLK